MAASSEDRPTSMTITLDSDLQRQVETAAAGRNMSVRDYVVVALQRLLAQEEGAEASSWSQLSARSFARDWNSEEDQIYDELAPG